MNQYDIFASEGGFRVCGGTYLGDPVIDASPWYPSIEEAEKGARKMRFDSFAKGVAVFEFDLRWTLAIGNDFYAVPSREQGVEEARKALVARGFTDAEIDAWRPDLKVAK